LIVDHPASGAWQMAVDEVLLETAASGGISSLRFYQWSEPTLSLGYFQSQADRAKHGASRGCQLVRRQTGGGAIVHDVELTYCLALHMPERSAAAAARLYQVAHTALADVLAARGVEVTVLKGRQEERNEASKPLLCFERRALGDVLLGDSKICGSAQRRLKGAVLQHGSLLLGRSESAPELPGLAELTGKRWKVEDFIEPWARELADRLALHWTDDALSPEELSRVRSLAIEKYSAASWNARR
jgi:lipoate-protein ligase A